MIVSRVLSSSSSIMRFDLVFLLRLCLLSLSLCPMITWAGTPLQNLHVTLRGRQYDVSEVETLQDLQQKMQEASGLPPSQQGSLLWNGKKLNAASKSSSSSSSSLFLRDVGITDGAQLQFKKEEASANGSASGDANSDVASSLMENMESLLQQAGVDQDKLDDMMKQMGLGGSGSGGGAGMPSLQESMEMMHNLMNSPMFQEYMNDPVKLEESRQMILNNPLLQQMMASMPGMQQLLQDANAWREAMQAAANLYKTMDTQQLLQMMNSNNNNNNGSGSGGMAYDPTAAAMNDLFGGTLDGTMNNNNLETTTALDELDEEEEED